MKQIHRKRNLLRLSRYVWENRALGILAFAFSVVGTLTTFVFPWIIGRLIDDLMIGSVSSPVEREHILWRLTTMAIVASISFSISGYGRGHFNMLFGNK